MLAGLPEAQVRARPHPGLNTAAWLVWHAARVEDVLVNRFVADRPQVLDAGWPERLDVARRDIGTGMNEAEVNELSARVDLRALRGYWDAVAQRSLAVAETLRSADLAAPVPAARVRGVLAAEGVLAPAAARVANFWTSGRSRAWFLAQGALLHVAGHYTEGRVVSSFWGVKGP